MLGSFKGGRRNIDVTVSQEHKIMSRARGGRYKEDRTKDESSTRITSAKIGLALS